MDNLKEIIKATYKKHFYLDLSDEEIDKEAEIIEKISKNKFVNEAGNSEKIYEYFSDKADGLAFSPTKLMEIVGRKMDEPDSEYYKTKEFVEIISIANCLDYFNESMGRKWHIILRDSPDIKLLDGKTVNLKERTKLVVYIEVMQFPQLSLGDLDKNFVSLIAKEIKEKKFRMRYGKSWLLVNMMSNEPTSEQIRLLASTINSMEGNPYSEIYLTNIPLFSNVLKLDMLFPQYKELIEDNLGKYK